MGMLDPSGIIEAAVSAIPERPSVQSVIGSCSILNPLNEAEREKVIEGSQMAFAERSETIWLAGMSSKFFAVLGSGFVKMTRNAPHGTEIAVELLGPGQCFGLLAALEGRDFPLSATAVTPCWYLKTPSSVITEVYATNADLRDQMLRTLGPRLRRAHEMMARLSSGKVEQRVAAVLLILGESYGRLGKHGGVRLNVPLTRQDIAEMAGTTVETCIRVMSKWQKAATVTTDHQVITIRKPHVLNETLSE